MGLPGPGGSPRCCGFVSRGIIPPPPPPPSPGTVPPLAQPPPPPCGGGGPPQQPAHPQYANYWAPLTRKRHTIPHSAHPQHTNPWAPRTRKRHQQEHRPQRPTESSDPTQHAKGRTGDCPGPRKGTTTQRNVTQGGGGFTCAEGVEENSSPVTIDL